MNVKTNLSLNKKSREYVGNTHIEKVFEIIKELEKTEDIKLLVEIVELKDNLEKGLSILVNDLEKFSNLINKVKKNEQLRNF